MNPDEMGRIRRLGAESFKASGRHMSERIAATPDQVERLIDITHDLSLGLAALEQRLAKVEEHLRQSRETR